MNLDRNSAEGRSPASADVGRLGLVFSAFGLTIGVELCEPFRPDEFIPALPPGHELVRGGSVDQMFRLEYRESGESPVSMPGYHWFRGETFLGIALSPQQVVDSAESVIEHYIAEFAPEWVFIHAGVVTWRGVAVVLPGDSMSGKSTLVTALVNAGATYFSDEYAVLDAEGIVYPYPRRVSQRQGPYGPAGRIDLAHRAPEPAEAAVGAPVALVVIARFDEAGTWRVTSLTPGAAMMAMSRHVVAIRRRPADALAVMSRVVQGAAVVEGVRGEAADAAARILESLDAAGQPGADASAAIGKHLA